MRAFGDAGCRYLQLDEVYMIVLVDPKQRQFFIEHGNEPDKLPELVFERKNPTRRCLDDVRPRWRHRQRTFAAGNFRSTFLAGLAGTTPSPIFCLHQDEYRRCILLE